MVLLALLSKARISSSAFKTISLISICKLGSIGIFFIPLSYKRRIVFKSIFKSLHWRDYKKANDNESVSGLGSDLKTCEKLIEDLSLFIQKHKIKSILDLACGDFNWMRKLIELHTNIQAYRGLDIVDEIVEKIGWIGKNIGRAISLVQTGQIQS